MLLIRYYTTKALVARKINKMNFHYLTLFAQTYNCGTYGAGTYNQAGECETTAVTPTSPIEQLLASTGDPYALMVGAGVGTLLIGASVVLFVAMRRRRKSRKTSSPR